MPTTVNNTFCLFDGNRNAAIIANQELRSFVWMHGCTLYSCATEWDDEKFNSGISDFCIIQQKSDYMYHGLMHDK